MTDAAKLNRALVDLVVASHIARLEDLPRMVAEHAGAAGLRDVVFFVADLQGKVLRQITGRGLDAGEGGTEYAVGGTVPGLAYRRVDLIAEPGGHPDEPGLRRWWMPVTDGVERLGVLRADTDLEGEAVRDALYALASVVALLLLSKRAFSDSYARLVRTEAMSVSAEMQWHLTPPSAFAGAGTTVAALSEPAYEVGGDAFDYAVADSVLHMAVFDAMGHDATAGLTANMAIGACRNARRQGADLVGTSRAIEDTLIAQFGHSRYVTGVLADLDMRTGALTWINRGHHLPVLLRAGRWSRELYCPPAGPMGTGLGLPVTVSREQLEPGDRIILYTDGIVEARNDKGEEFGLQRFTDYIVRHNADGLTVHETLRQLVHAVVDQHAGHLVDDATVLLAEWLDPDQDGLLP
ncbi:PP2C family protein-serine/threonine phosphatase [Streptomyces chilikensis]|uniref:PP2C family protein-serine/threonine phosphatase n=1 Tax=Streptomyces chilikensis TaxID=1194079 RepID=A0ABV3EM14_9ACTN